MTNNPNILNQMSRNSSNVSHEKFNITNFASTAEYAMNDERVARTTMDLTLYGYIIPDSINRDLATNGKRQFFSKSTVAITTETVRNLR